MPNRPRPGPSRGDRQQDRQLDDRSVAPRQCYRSHCSLRRRIEQPWRKFERRTGRPCSPQEIHILSEGSAVSGKGGCALQTSMMKRWRLPSQQRNCLRQTTSPLNMRDPPAQMSQHFDRRACVRPAHQAAIHRGLAAGLITFATVIR